MAMCASVEMLFFVFVIAPLFLCALGVTGMVLLLRLLQRRNREADALGAQTGARQAMRAEW